jgi:hypothetical protein
MSRYDHCVCVRGGCVAHCDDPRQLAKAVVTAIGSSVAQYWTGEPPQHAIVSLGAELLQFFHAPDDGALHRSHYILLVAV